jgi:hypothetical protein
LAEWTSSPGVTWTQITTTGLSGEPQFRGFVYIDNLYIITSDTTPGTLYTSTNAVNWSAITTNLSSAPNSISKIGSNWIAVFDGGGIATSTDLTTWTGRTSGTSQNFNQVVSNGTIAVAVANLGIIRTSSDGVTWSTRTSGTTANLTAVFWNGSLWVIVGVAQSVYSSDGITWTLGGAMPGFTAWRGLTWTNGQWIAVDDSGSDSELATSNDSVTWSSQTVTGQGLYAVATAGTITVAVGYSTIVRSNNNVTWTQPLSTGGLFTGVVWDASRFVAMADTTTGSTNIYVSN